ncbi:MAG: hypothetical protein V1909_00025, partial [Candidatus Micrarchaeota archaeon]
MILNELPIKSRFQRPFIEFEGGGSRFFSANRGGGNDSRFESLKGSSDIVLNEKLGTDARGEAYLRIVKAAWGMITEKRRLDIKYAEAVVDALKQTGTVFVSETFELLSSIIKKSEGGNGDVGKLFELATNAINEIARPALEKLIETIQTYGTTNNEGVSAYTQIMALVYQNEKMPKKTQLEIVRALKIISMRTNDPAKSFLSYTSKM